MGQTMKSEHQQSVERFMELAGQDVPAVPTEPTEAVRLLRARIILEEAFETMEKGLGVSVGVPFQRPLGFDDLSFYIDGSFDLIELVDGCCDLKVVTTGTLSACGVHDVEVQAAVDANNLAKFGPGAVKREDGKWIKPPNHPKPDLKRIIEANTPGHGPAQDNQKL